MKAVIWNDVLQTIIIFIGLLAAIIQGSKKRIVVSDLFHLLLGLITLGGFKRTFSIAFHGGRLIFAV